jgi:hypothetical protein
MSSGLAGGSALYSVEVTLEQLPLLKTGQTAHDLMRIVSPRAFFYVLVLFSYVLCLSHRLTPPLPPTFTRP